MGRPLKVGIILPYSERQMNGTTARWSDLLTFARRAEELGYDSLWVPDHLLRRREGIEPQGMWEAFSVLAALAASTRRLTLGTLVACTSFRNPGLVAKMADTIDEISQGRFVLGLGAGYHEPEYRAFGFPYDHRVGRFEEALTIIQSLLRDGKVDFDGRFYQLEDCELRPRGPRPNGPPIMVGTTGDRMLRLTARYADAWNHFLLYSSNTAAEIPAMRQRVDAACREVGRDPTTLERTAAILIDPFRTDQASGTRFNPYTGLPMEGPAPDVNPLTGSPEQIAEGLLTFAREGIAHVQLWFTPNTHEAVEALAPALALLDRYGG